MSDYVSGKLSPAEEVQRFIAKAKQEGYKKGLSSGRRQSLKKEVNDSMTPITAKAGILGLQETSQSWLVIEPFDLTLEAEDD
jgi:flagellar biosynthesis/type III secretory pathway protein FliH